MTKSICYFSKNKSEYKYMYIYIYICTKYIPFSQYFNKCRNCLLQFAPYCKWQYQCVRTRFNLILFLDSVFFTSQYYDRYYGSFKVTLEFQYCFYYMRFLLLFLWKHFILLHVPVYKGLMEMVRTARTVLNVHWIV